MSAEVVYRGLACREHEHAAQSYFGPDLRPQLALLNQGDDVAPITHSAFLLSWVPLQHTVQFCGTYLDISAARPRFGKPIGYCRLSFGMGAVTATCPCTCNARSQLPGRLNIRYYTVAISARGCSAFPARYGTFANASPTD